MRPIDADALRARMYHEAFETDTDMQKWDSGCWIRYKLFENCIDDAPTISPDEVRGVGEWIDCPSTHIQDGAKYRMCSVCNEHIAVLGHDLNYCPNCGARMKGAEDGTTDAE